MEKKHKHQKVGKTHIPAANSFASYDHSGWLSRLSNDGWLKKRWRRRYCILSNGTLYLYEKQTAKGTEATSIAIDLSKFSSCIKASGKDSKKSPNTIILEPTVPNDVNDVKEHHHNNAARELFFTDDAVDIDKWMSKLKEALSLSCAGGKSKLEHVTKSRARPPRGGGGGNRRPPTKQHIKERARMSEIVMDEEREDPRKSARESRARIPVTAMKPTGKPIMPNISRNIETKPDAEKSQTAELEDANNLDGSSEQSKPDSANTKSPPKLPPSALKPKSNSTDKLLLSKSEENEDKSELSEEHLNESESTDAPANLSTANESKLNENKTKCPPKLPPVAMKPKCRPSESAENGDDDDPVDNTDYESPAIDSEPAVVPPQLAINKESSPTQNQPPPLPSAASKPKGIPEKSKPSTDEQEPTEDSANANSESSVKSSESNCDLADDIASDEAIGDTTVKNSDILMSKSLPTLKQSTEHENTDSRNRSNSF